MTAGRRILALTTASWQEPCSRLRVYQHEAAFTDRGADLRVQPFMSSALYRVKNRPGLLWQLVKVILLAGCTVRRLWAIARMRRYDTLFVQKESFPWGGAWVERRAKALGMRIVYDIDDGVFVAHDMVGGWRRLWWDPRRVPEIMQLADAVIVGSEALAEYAGQYTDDVWVIGTAVPDRYFGVPPREAESGMPRIGWIGTQTNLQYLKGLGSVLCEVYASHPFELWVVGGPNVLDLEMGPIPIHASLWSEDAEAECLSSIDIGVMPLADDEWTRYKCGYKLVQYMAAGRAAVASAVGENRNLAVHGANGMLCRSDADWISALTWLISDGSARASMGRAGRRAVERFSASTVGLHVASVVIGCAGSEGDTVA